MAKIKHRGLYRTPENSYLSVSFDWKHKRVWLLNIVTGHRWPMPLDALRTFRYLSRLTFCGGVVKRYLKPVNQCEASSV